MPPSPRCHQAGLGKEVSVFTIRMPPRGLHQRKLRLRYRGAAKWTSTRESSSSSPGGTMEPLPQRLCLHHQGILASLVQREALLSTTKMPPRGRRSRELCLSPRRCLASYGKKSHVLHAQSAAKVSPREPSTKQSFISKIFGTRAPSPSPRSIGDIIVKLELRLPCLEFPRSTQCQVSASRHLLRRMKYAMWTSPHRHSKSRLLLRHVSATTYAGNTPP